MQLTRKGVCPKPRPSGTKGSVTPEILDEAVYLRHAVLAFPFISQYAYYKASKAVVKNFTEEKEKLTPEDVLRRIGLAMAYNDALYNGYGDSKEETRDPFTKEEHEAGKKEYARMLEINEQIGTIIIPKISEELPVYAGTTETVLQKGAGHLEGTSLPVGGNNSHSVITPIVVFPMQGFLQNLTGWKREITFILKISRKPWPIRWMKSM